MSTSRRAPAALGAVLVLALALRLWGIQYGLPWLFYFHDEPQVVLRALRFGTGDLNPHFFIWPGTLLLYLAFIAYAGWFVIGRVLGWWSGKAGFAAAYFADPSPFYLLARLQSVAFGVWGVWLANGLGRAAYGPAVGLAAALGLAINAVAAHYAHFAHPVSAMTACTLLGLWAAVRIAEDGDGRDMMRGALALGFGVAAQYHAALLAVPLGLAVLMRAARERERAGWWISRGLLMALGGLALFLLLSPYTLLDYPAFRADLSWVTAKTAGTLDGGPARGALAGLTGFVLTCVVPGLGMPLTLAAAAGALVALVRRTRADLVLLAFVTAYLLLASRASSVNDRYSIPLVVPALLFAARLVNDAVAGLFGLRWTRAWLPAVAMLALCAPVTLTLLETNTSMTRGDTRVDALRWFEAHVPADSKVVLDMLRFWNSATAPLNENRVRLEARIREVEHGVSGAGHSRAYLDYYRYLLEHPRQPGYDLLSTEMGTMAPSLEQARRDGYQWAMVSEEAAASVRGRIAPGDSSGPAFYRALEREGALEATFSPIPWQRRGPVIRVYRIGPR